MYCVYAAVMLCHGCCQWLVNIVHCRHVNCFSWIFSHDFEQGCPFLRISIRCVTKRVCKLYNQNQVTFSHHITNASAKQTMWKSHLFAQNAALLFCQKTLRNTLKFSPVHSWTVLQFAELSVCTTSQDQ